MVKILNLIYSLWTISVSKIGPFSHTSSAMLSEIVPLWQPLPLLRWTLCFTQPNFKQIWHQAAALCNRNGEEGARAPSSSLSGQRHWRLSRIKSHCSDCCDRRQVSFLLCLFVCRNRGKGSCVRGLIWAQGCMFCPFLPQEIIWVIQLLCSIYVRVMLCRTNTLHRSASCGASFSFTHFKGGQRLVCVFKWRLGVTRVQVYFIWGSKLLEPFLEAYWVSRRLFLIMD